MPSATKPGATKLGGANHRENIRCVLSGCEIASYGQRGNWRGWPEGGHPSGKCDRCSDRDSRVVHDGISLHGIRVIGAAGTSSKHLRSAVAFCAGSGDIAAPGREDRQFLKGGIEEVPAAVEHRQKPEGCALILHGSRGIERRHGFSRAVLKCDTAVEIVAARMKVGQENGRAAGFQAPWFLARMAFYGEGGIDRAVASEARKYRSDPLAVDSQAPTQVARPRIRD